jgi:hypothetical protein
LPPKAVVGGDVGDDDPEKAIDLAAQTIDLRRPEASATNVYAAWEY